MAARVRLPYFSSLPSKRSKSVKASAVPPAKPAITLSVMKGNARKVRKLYNDKVIAGFAGGTADAFTLFERFEGKLEKYGNLTRAAIELAKDWRSDRYLRRLEAL